MKTKKHRWLCLLLTLLSYPGQAQDFPEYAHRQFISKSDTLRYRILYPADFNPAQKYPVLFFLHGAGERGDNNEAQLVHGGRLFLQDSVRQNFPAIVIFPQCPQDSYWSNVNIVTEPGGKRHFNFLTGCAPMPPLRLLLDLVKQTRSEKHVDKKRLYVGGLSMGGMGTFEVLRREPRYFAAAFAICGGDNVANARKYRKVPLWVFHGGKDDVVAPHLSGRVVAQLKALGAKEVKHTVYPNANHNSWDAAFAEPGLLPWLFSQER
ncbi:dienelactone hydrolase family protein [Rufibacter sp. XAAS-G3-1]|uniref:carboxylesterase family protein n=1 Tax=Rufibacter sp. XAAS-G3-1 TaxID=2729134 RepID=UPI0015E767E2|nr:dienelactone hydrolase family protein [Rufibacter sp. XAAS-G3-1]